MTILRRLADTSRSPSPALLPRLRSVASSLLKHQYSTDNGCEGNGLLNGGSGSSSTPRPVHAVFVDPPSRRCFDSRAVGIRQNDIPLHAWTILRRLQEKGFDAYLVGGCVRDLLLKRVPKDFDVITTASLKEINKMLKHCIIVGRRFPICQVKMGAFTVEVSNFSTNGTQVNESEEVDCLESSNSCIDTDILRGENSMKRDFTINSLFFNPMTCRIYDYVNGVRDLRQNLVCTVIPAHESFKEDPARILRGLRIAARLGFKISSETSRAIQDLCSSIITLPKARLMMEMNCMLSYGSAESSVRLLRNYGLLDILLPLQAAYMSDQMKGGTGDRDLMLMKLLAHMDKLFSPNRPCHRTLWLALLAFHSALITSPQDAKVVRAFAGLLQFGSWESTMNFLKQDVQARPSFVPETLGSSQTKLDNLMEQTSHLVSLINSSVETLTCLGTLQQSVARYSETSQFSGVVFASKTDRGRLLRIFEGLDSDLTFDDRRRGVSGPHRIDYKSLKDGDPDEVRFVLGKVIIDTMNEALPCASTEDAAISRTPVTDLADRNDSPLSMLFQSY